MWGFWFAWTEAWWEGAAGRHTFSISKHSKPKDRELKQCKGARKASVTQKVKNSACDPEEPVSPTLFLGHTWEVRVGVVSVDFAECSGTSWRWKHGLYRMSRSSLETPGGEGDSRQSPVAEAEAWRGEMSWVGMCSFIKNMLPCVMVPFVCTYTCKLINTCQAY